MKAAAIEGARATASDWIALAKPRLTFYVLVVVWAGAMLASRGTIAPMKALHAVLGTALVAASASALNMVFERRFDALMRRTVGRPIPTGRIGPREATLLAMGAGAAGMVELLLFTTPLAALLAFLTSTSYVGLYTPLKRVTTLNTHVGAIPGALPVLIGWSAAGRPVDAAALALFFVLYLWQIPHFLAIAWIHREDYARGGYRMLSVVDGDGAVSGRQAVLGAVAVAGVSLHPALTRLTTDFYSVSAALLGAYYVFRSVRFALRRDDRRARSLLRASLLYVPAFLFVLLSGAGVLP